MTVRPLHINYLGKPVHASYANPVLVKARQFYNNKLLYEASKGLWLNQELLLKFKVVARKLGVGGGESVRHRDFHHNFCRL